jgi:hypothetical protein
MRFVFGIKGKQRRISRSVILFLAFIFALLLTITWAGIRQDPSGNIIKGDVVAPAGGARITSSGGNVVNASAGQCAVGLSQSASGRKLYHGVHSPIITPTYVNNWQTFNK